MKTTHAAGLISLAIAGISMNVAGGTNWTNTDSTYPPGATQSWDVPANWGGALPATGSGITITNSGAALLSSTQSMGTIIIGNSAAGGSLYIGGTGDLSFSDTGNTTFRLYNTGPVRAEVASGGKLTVGGAITLGSGSASAKFVSAGTVSAKYVQVSGGGTYNMTGGSLTATQTYASVNPVNGTFQQSGGAVSSSGGALQLGATGVYEISGGSISMGSGTGLYFSGATASSGGTIRVVGSSASNISFGGLRYVAANDGNNAKYSFVLDNAANHITPITLINNGNSGAVLRTGATLEVGLNGGVLLSGTNTFTILTRPSGTDTAWGSGPGALWTDSTGTTKNTLKVSLAAGADKGTLDATGSGSVSFGASNYGYVDLTHVNLAQPLELLVDVTGGTLSNFTTALTNAGVTWAANSGAYDLKLTLDPTVSGGTKFAWDLGKIDAAMQMQSIAIIPEPASFGLIAMGAAALMLRRRHR